MRYNIAHGLVTAAQNAPNARKVTAGLPWREAASVMLVAPGQTELQSSLSPIAQNSSKPQFLVTQRSRTSGSFSSILCFPGGNACKADSDLKWIDSFSVVTATDVENTQVSFIEESGSHPLIYNMSHSKNAPKTKISYGDFMKMKSVPKSIALRVTAIRETFEETGVLLCKLNTSQTVGKGIGKDCSLGVGYEANVCTFEDPEELKNWQIKVRKNPDQFFKMCKSLGCLPDVNALVEWNDWLTPNCFGMQRYDTIFYMAVLPQCYPMYTCPEEVESASWISAEQVLKDCEERNSKMITPQIYELSRLRSSTISRIYQLMKIRLKLGIERWCPAYIRAKDGYLSVLPGDDLYPEDIKIYAFEPIPSVDSTLDELRNSTSHHHRVEYRSEFDFKMVIKDYKVSAGQIYLD